MLLSVLQEEETGDGERQTLGLHDHEGRADYHRDLCHGRAGDRLFTRFLHRSDQTVGLDVFLDLRGLGNSLPLTLGRFSHNDHCLDLLVVHRA